MYAGETTEPRHAVIDGAIHIFSNDCGGGTLAIAATGTDGSKFGGKIRMCRSNAGGDIRWDTFDRSGGRSFHGVLLHELGHLIGMGHLEDCGSTDRSVMHANYGNWVSDHLQRPDIRFVHSRWGRRSTIGRPKWTWNGVSWANGGASPPIHSDRVLGRFAVSNTRTAGNNVYAAWADSTLAVVWLSRYTPAAWDVRSGFFETVTYHPGVASRSEKEVFLTWLGNLDSTTGLQEVLARRSTNGGLTFGPEEPVSDAVTGTANAGVTASYDSESDSYVVIWRGSRGVERNSIIYRVMDKPTGPWKLNVPGENRDLKAADTPTIAFAPKRVVGEYNGLMAWVDAFHWQRPVRWTQVRVTPDGRLEMLAIKTHPYVTVGGPSVAYWSNGQFPWLIALYQGGTSTYTWRKRASHSENFQDERSFSFRPKVTLPAAGSRLRGGAGRGYVFTADE